MPIYYKQSVNTKTGGWCSPLKTEEWSADKSTGIRWKKLKPSAMDVLHKIPFAINKIERWHKKKGHTVDRQVRVAGGYRIVFLKVIK